MKGGELDVQGAVEGPIAAERSNSIIRRICGIVDLQVRGVVANPGLRRSYVLSHVKGDNIEVEITGEYLLDILDLHHGASADLRFCGFAEGSNETIPSIRGIADLQVFVVVANPRLRRS